MAIKEPSSYDYRVIKAKIPSSPDNPELIDIFAICEVYYDEHNQIMNVGEEAAVPLTDNLSDLKNLIVQYSQAFLKPIIDIDELEKEKNDKANDREPGSSDN